MARDNGFVFYRGASLIDGAPIVGILTGLRERSRNPKTGDMLQTWILRSHVRPDKATRTGQDASVCGDCKHRPAIGGSCYVKVDQAPLQVYKSYRQGRYPLFDRAKHLPMLGGRVLRCGAYGDPAAIPLDAWMPLLVAAEGHTGYTHQWHTCDQDWRRFIMASADSTSERDEAQAMGWRTFRVMVDLDTERGEIVCPASPEGGERRQCISCRACDGQTESGRGVSVAILAHGGGKTAYKAERFRRMSLEMVS